MSVNGRRVNTPTDSLRRWWRTTSKPMPSRTRGAGRKRRGCSGASSSACGPAGQSRISAGWTLRRCCPRSWLARSPVQPVTLSLRYGGLLNWAVHQGYLERSPCEGIKRRPSIREPRSRPKQRRTRFGMGGSAEARLALRLHRSTLDPHSPTAQRGRRNALGRIEPHPTAFGPFPRTDRSGCAHVLPLSAQAIVLIKGLPKLNDYLVFPARGKNTSVSGYSKWKAGLDEAAGLTDWRLHDLRRTAATKMAGLKIAYEVRETHSQPHAERPRGCLQSPPLRN